MDTKGGKWRGSAGGGGMNWEIGIDIYTLIRLKWITNKNLLYKKINKVLKKTPKKPHPGCPDTFAQHTCSWQAPTPMLYLISNHLIMPLRLGFQEMEILPWMGRVGGTPKFSTLAFYLSPESGPEKCRTLTRVHTNTHVHTHPQRTHMHPHTHVPTHPHPREYTHMHTQKHIGDTDT